jgi:hypothetical protein
MTEDDLIMTESDPVVYPDPCRGPTEESFMMLPQELDKLQELDKSIGEIVDWSLFVGKQASEVEAKIRQTRPDLHVEVLTEVLYSM